MFVFDRWDIRLNNIIKVSYIVDVYIVEVNCLFFNFYSEFILVIGLVDKVGYLYRNFWLNLYRVLKIF